MKTGTGIPFRLLFTIAAGTIFNPLNSSMISVALPSIQGDFQLSYATVSWLISSFYLASAVALPVMGKIGDQLGFRKMFLGGLLLVAVSSVAAPWAPSFIVLLLMRLFQAIGSSSIYPAGVSIINRQMPGNRGSAMAVIAVCASVAAALGPTLGGFLIAWGGWPAIFTGNFPLLILSSGLAWLYLPRDDERTKRPAREIVRNLDIPGIILFALTVTFAIWFLLSLESRPHLPSGLAALVLLGAFVWREMRVAAPFIDIRFFLRHGELAIVYGQYILMNTFFYALFFGLPTYFQFQLGLDPGQSGLMMAFMSGSAVLVSPGVGRWIDRRGIARPLLAGALSTGVGALLLAAFFADAPLALGGAIIAVAGVGYGAQNVTLQAAMMKLSPPAMIGVSAGLFQTSRFVGSILASVVLGLFFCNEISPRSMQSLADALVAVSLLCCLAAVSLWRKTRRLPDKG